MLEYSFIKRFNLTIIILLFCTCSKAQFVQLITPVNKSNNLNILSVQLTWTSSCDSFKVFLGHASENYDVINGEITHYNEYGTSVLNINKEYYWKVIGYKEKNTFESPEWSFQTMRNYENININIEYGTVKNGIGYFQSHKENRVSALDINNFKKIHDFYFEGIYDTPPLVEKTKNGTWLIIELETENNRLKALYLSSGELAWASKSNLINYGGTAFKTFKNSDGITSIIISCQDGLHCISIEDGNELWHYPGYSPVYHAIPAINERQELIYYQDQNRLSILNANTGTPIKIRNDLPKITMHTNTLITDDEYGKFIASLWFDIYERSNLGTLIVMDSMLNTVWEKRIHLDNLSTISYNKGKIFTGQASGFYPEQYTALIDSLNWKYISAFNIQNGSTIWETKMDKFKYTDIIDVLFCNNSLYAMDDSPGYNENRFLLRLDADNGAILDTFNYNFPWSVCATPIITNGTLIEGGMAIHLGSGEKTDWESQYNSQMNHFNAPENAIKTFSKMTYKISLITQIKNFLPIILSENQADTLIYKDLNEYFSKSFEDQEPLKFSIISSNNNILYKIDNCSLLASIKPDFNGYDTISIIASSEGYTMRKDIPVYVKMKNYSPYISKNIENIELNEDFDKQTIYLKNYITDPNNDQLNYKLISVNKFFSALIEGNILEIKSRKDLFGIDTLVVQISDAEYSIFDSIPITIKAINDPPFYKGNTSLTLEVNKEKIINLWQLFSDAETPSSELDYHFYSNNKYITLTYSNETGSLHLQISDDALLVDTTTQIYIMASDGQDKSEIIINIKFEHNNLLVLNDATSIRDELTINFYLPQLSNVTLTVFTIHGIEKRKIRLNSCQKGFNTTQINISDLTPSAYLYRLEASNSIESSTKIAVVKKFIKI